MEQVAKARLLHPVPGAQMEAVQTRNICHLAMRSMALHKPEVQCGGGHCSLWLGPEPGSQDNSKAFKFLITLLKTHFCLDFLISFFLEEHSFVE